MSQEKRLVWEFEGKIFPINPSVPPRDPTYISWEHMKARCNRKRGKKAHLYNGKGITYDPRWESFRVFYEDMGPRPEGTSLDRYPDKNGNYCKENCRWATPIEQNRNRNPYKKRG